MADITTISTEELLRIRQQSDIRNVPTEQLQAIRAGTELASGDISPERTEEERRAQLAAEGQRADQQLSISATEFLRPIRQISRQALQTTDTFSLLEAVNQAKLFKDKSRRSMAFS